MLRLPALALAIALLAPRPGVAAPAEAGTKDSLLREAAAFERQGDHQRALESLQAAYAASGDARIQYDIGRACERLRQPVEAVAAFSKFLDGAPDAPQLYRADAEKRRADLRRTLRAIEVRCDVPGAVVTIDDRAVGQTPLPGPVDALRAAHRVRVDKPGFFPFTATLAPEETVVTVALRPVPVEPALPAPRVEAATPPAELDRAPAAVVTTAAGESAEPPARAAGLELTAGPVIWTDAHATQSTTPGITVAGGAPVATLDGLDTTLRLGGKLSLTPEGAPRTSYFVSFLASASLRRPLGPHLVGFLGFDAGLLLLAALDPDSKLLKEDSVMHVNPPGLLALELRPSLGLEYALSPRWSLLLAPQLVWDTRPDSHLAYATLLRFELGAGVGVRF